MRRGTCCPAKFPGRRMVQVHVEKLVGKQATPKVQSAPNVLEQQGKLYLCTEDIRVQDQKMNKTREIRVSFIPRRLHQYLVESMGHRLDADTACKAYTTKYEVNLTLI